MLTEDIQVSLKDVVIFLCEWAPDCSTIADQQEHRYYKIAIVKALSDLLTKYKTDQTMLRPAFPTNHQLHDTIVWDTETSQYYNKKTDIYLSDDDVAFHKLEVQYLVKRPKPGEFRGEGTWEEVTKEEYEKYATNNFLPTKLEPKLIKDPLRAKLDSDLAEVLEKKFPEMRDEKKDPTGPDQYEMAAKVFLAKLKIASSDLEREMLLTELAEADLAILDHIVKIATK